MLGATLTSQQYLKQLRQELKQVDLEALQRWSDLVYRAWESGQYVFVCGNGGSACTASHISEDLGKSLLHQQDLSDDSKKRLKILSLTDNVGWITAIANDLAFDQVFKQQLANYASPGDLLIAISGSGNSPNILDAVSWANRQGLITFGLSGFDGGRLKTLQQDGLHVTVGDMGMVESIHLCLFHWMLDEVFARINQQGRYQK